MTNPNEYYEQRARTLKAQQLATHLRIRGVKSAHLDRMHPNIRSHHAMAAGVNAPSDETWEMTAKMMKAAEDDEARHPDPFAGLS